MKALNGGPAFPQGVAIASGDSLVTSQDFVNGAGMTLRDYFAGQALAGLLASGICGSDALAAAATLDGSSEPITLAKTAYGFAGAMLKVREAAS